MTLQQPMFPPSADRCAWSAGTAPPEAATGRRAALNAATPSPTSMLCEPRCTCLQAATATKSCLSGQPTAGIPHDLAARFGSFYERWREQRRRDELETADDPDLAGWQALNLELADLQARIMSCHLRTLMTLSCRLGFARWSTASCGPTPQQRGWPTLARARIVSCSRISLRRAAPSCCLASRRFRWRESSRTQ
ncbi:hypothetical protein ACVIJW_005039 [Bradyrhizobium barranii subsp. barranii]